MLFLQGERAQEACPGRTQCFPWEVSLDRLRAALQGPRGLARAHGRGMGLPPQPAPQSQSSHRLGHQVEPRSICGWLLSDPGQPLGLIPHRKPRQPSSLGLGGTPVGYHHRYLLLFLLFSSFLTSPGKVTFHSISRLLPQFLSSLANSCHHKTPFPLQIPLDLKSWPKPAQAGAVSCGGGFLGKSKQSLC